MATDLMYHLPGGLVQGVMGSWFSVLATLGSVLAERV